MNEIDDVFWALICKPIREVYSDIEEEPFYGPGDYDKLLESFGCEIILKVDDDGYEGDSRVLYHLNGRYGLLIFGFGSCSGCDALQACQTFDEIEDLRKRFITSIHWDTAEGMHHYIANKDWELEYCYHQEETKRFIDEALKLLHGLK